MKLLKNYLYNLSYQILAIIIPIVTLPYISRVLEVDGIGKYSFSLAIVNYFILMGMVGISTYGSRQIAYVRENKKKLEETFWAINIIKFFTMGLSILLYLLYTIFLVSSSDKLLYLLQGLTLIGSLFDITWFFIGIEDFKKTALRNSIVKIIGVMLIFTFVRSKEDLWLYALILSSSMLVGQLVLWKDIGTNIKYKGVSKSELIYHFKGTMHLWLPTISINVYTSFDTILLGYFTNDIQVGLYENSQKIVKVITTITTTVATVSIPKVSNLYIKKDNEQLNDLLLRSFAIVSLLAIPMTFGIISISNSLVPWFYGDGFETISFLLKLSAWLIITLSWSSLFGRQILVSFGRENKFSVAVTVGAISNLILNFIFIPRFGASGAIIASVFSEFLGMFIMMYYASSLINLKKAFSYIPKYFACSLVMSLMVYQLGEYLGYSIFTTIIQGFTGVSVYIVLIIILKDENLRYLINTFKSKRQKK